MKKILLITHGFLPDIDGGIIVINDYANLLFDLGYDVTLISKAYSDPIQHSRFHYIQVPNKYGEYLWLFNFGSFFNSFSFDKYDCIILNQYPISTVAGKYFNKNVLQKCIPIIQGHEVEGIYQNRNIIHNWMHLLLRMKHCHRRAMLLSRKVISVSEFHKWKVVKAAGLQAYADRFHVVYTGIDKNIFQPVFSDFRQKMKWESKELLITVSRIEKMKGYVEMLNVFEKLVLQDDNYQWVIIGDGPFLNELKQLVDKKQLSDKVSLLGLKLRKELNYYYSAANCFWLLSNYDETFGLVYLEAQACGLPAIGFNKGGVAEAIKHERTGFLVKNEEECFDILINKKYKGINRDNLFIFANQFDKVKAAKKLIS